MELITAASPSPTIKKADKIHDERIAKILEEITPLYQDVGRIVGSYIRA